METRSLRTVVLCTAAFLVIVSASIGWFRSMTTASVTENPLKGLTITPHEQVTVEAGGTMRFTAEGDFGTKTMPVRADWFLIENEGKGTLEGCRQSKTCTFTAGEAEGVAVLQAQVGDGEAIDTVKITIEASLRNPFTDDLPSWALEAIVRLNRAGIVKGYDDGRYGPADPVTRGQVVTLIKRALYGNDPIACDRSYADVPSSHFAAEAACLFHAKGWAGDTTRFRPDDQATRGETAAFLQKAFADRIGETTIKAAFDDMPADHPQAAAIAAVNATGIMTGYANGDFGPDDPLNRAAAATVLERALRVKGKTGVKPFPAPSAAAPQSSTSTTTTGTSTNTTDWNTISLPAHPSSQQSVTAVSPAWQWPDGWLESEGRCKKSDAPSRPASAKCCELCPASDANRYYVPFEGNDCEPGDARRDDLSSAQCANPLMENRENLPETYGARCPQRLRSQLDTPSVSGQSLLAQVIGADSAATEALCTQREAELRTIEAELTRATAALAETTAELAQVDAQESLLKEQLSVAQQRFASYLPRRASFRQNAGKYMDSQGYPMDGNGHRIAEFVEAETTLQKYEHALEFQKKLRAPLEPVRKQQQDTFDTLKRQRDSASNALSDCKRNLDMQQTRERNAEAERRSSEETRRFLEWSKKISAREARGEIPPHLGLGRKCCNGQAIVESLRSCRYVRIDDIELAYLYPNAEVSIKNLKDFRAYMEKVEKANELLKGEAMTGMDLLIERITELADLLDIKVEIDNPVSSDAIMGQALAFLEEFQKRNPLIGITVKATPIVVDYSRLWTATTPPEGGLCVEAQWRKSEGHVSGILSSQTEMFQCPSDPTVPSFKFAGSSDRAAMCIPADQQELVATVTDLVAQMKRELLGGYQNDKLCPPQPELR